MLAIFPILSRDVTNQTLPGQELIVSVTDPDPDAEP
jgi:hypothetical protein